MRFEAVQPAYPIKHRDEFESMEGSGDSTWRLARKALGTSAFGFNLVEIDPGGQIPEHDETGSGQVELFIVLEGEAVMRLDGKDHPAPAGTFASIEPPATRTIINRSDASVTAMLIGVHPAGDYEPMSWTQPIDSVFCEREGRALRRAGRHTPKWCIPQ